MNQLLDRYEAEAIRILDKLADDMTIVSLRMKSLLAHDPAAAAHAQELAGASETVRQWVARLKSCAIGCRILQCAVGQRVRVLATGQVGTVVHHFERPDGQLVIILDIPHGQAMLRRHFEQAELDLIANNRITP